MLLSPHPLDKIIVFLLYLDLMKMISLECNGRYYPNFGLRFVFSFLVHT